MSQIVEFIPYIVATVGGFLLGGFLHEGGHWFVGWLGDTNPKIQWVFWIIPNGVDHEKMESMDAGLIQLSDASVFVWIPVSFGSVLLLLFNRSPEYLFISSIPVFILVMATESDAMAVRDPERFREMCLNEEFYRNPLFLPNWLVPDLLPRF